MFNGNQIHDLKLAVVAFYVRFIHLLFAFSLSALLYCFDLFLTTPLITLNYQKVCENYECYKIIKAYLFSSLFHFLVLFFKGCHLTFQTTDAKKTSDLKIAREGKPQCSRQKFVFCCCSFMCVWLFFF